MSTIETSTPATTTTAHDEGKTETITRKHWLPLESNPELMNKYIHTLGVTPFLEFHEILGTDPDLLSMIPTPVSAVLFLYPITDASEAWKKEEVKVIAEKGNQVSEKVYFVKQNIGNACGTIGLLHSILNNPDIDLDKNKFFAKFHAQTKDMTAAQRAEALEANTDIEESHQAVATEAKSDVNHASNDNLHFIAFVHVDGILYELDGMKTSPINHGKTTSATLLQDAVKVISQFMERDPKEIRFNMVALAPAQSFD